jgi:hypothetical protein
MGSGDENALKLIVVMVHNSVNKLKADELYMLASGKCVVDISVELSDMWHSHMCSVFSSGLCGKDCG